MLCATASFGQSVAAEKSVMKQLSKGKWHSAKHTVVKAIEKDSLSASAFFVKALYFFSPGNPDFNIDSARTAISRSVALVPYIPKKQQYKLARAGIDSVVIHELKEDIDSAGFQRARIINTEGAFIHFLRYFTTARQIKEAIDLRDEAAYLEAVRANTYDSFLSFLERYPKAARASEARKTYDRLLFESRTRDRTLASYESFLREHPATPYRPEVEKQIFEISTARGDLQSLKQYLAKYPRSTQATKAINIMYHVAKELDSVSQIAPFTNDSLRNIIASTKPFLSVFMKEGRYGFLSPEGEVVIRPHISAVPEEYLCEPVETDFVQTANSLIALDGSVFFRDSVYEVNDLGFGFLETKSGTCVKIIHKSGFAVNDCVETGKVVADRFIALKKNGQWGLYSFSGKMLTLHEWDEISSMNNFLALTKNEKHRLVSVELADQWEPKQPIRLSDGYDEIKSLNGDQIWVKKGEEFAILRSDLTAYIPFERHQIEPAFFGFTRSKAEGTWLQLTSGKSIGPFQKVKVSEPWVAATESGKWRILNRHLLDIGKEYDTVAFSGPFAAGITEDTLFVHVNDAVIIQFRQPATALFLPASDSGAFLLITDGQTKTVFNSMGATLFSGNYDEITYAGSGYFVVTRNGKKGLMSSSGKSVLPTEYDAIGSVANNIISLLKNMKFGAVHVPTGKIIKPQFDKNVLPYNNQYLVAYRGNTFGFIDWNGKPHGGTKYDEVKHWNDSIALVRNGFTWFFHNIQKNTNLHHGISSISFLREDLEEKLAVIKQDNFYGVVSSKSGFVVSPSFTLIRNMGLKDHPLYFTEKHVEEALIYVVIYYDRYGKFISRQVYEEHDYEKILCNEDQ